jgi:hypothetical protein
MVSQRTLRPQKPQTPTKRTPKAQQSVLHPSSQHTQSTTTTIQPQTLHLPHNTLNALANNHSYPPKNNKTLTEYVQEINAAKTKPVNLGHPLHVGNHLFTSPKERKRKFQTKRTIRLQTRTMTKKSEKPVDLITKMELFYVVV